jgi:wyosine [tRNA(Phe)-imidazoG37] synthetase (radical SAM superfamily)
MAPRLRELTSGSRSLLGIVMARWVFGGPWSVTLAVSSVCNTDCVMCPCYSPYARRAEDSHQMPELRPGPDSPAYLDPALFEMILREARQMGTYRIVLSGLGEPSLHPEFDRMLELMMRLDMEPLVLTNGIGIDAARAKIWATKRGCFRFSIHAGDHETWLRVHPGGTGKQFERLSQLIRLLVAAKGPRVSIMNVIHKANFINVRPMIEYARRLGVREVKFQPMYVHDGLAPLRYPAH